MTWNNVFVFVIALGWGVALTMLYRSNRLLTKTLRELSDQALTTVEGLSRTVHCLAYKVSEHGWVEISEEEWQASEESNVKIFRDEKENGVRVLAK